MPTVSINIDVDALEKGVAFYAAAVGLTPVRRLGDQLDAAGYGAIATSYVRPAE